MALINTDYPEGHPNHGKILALPSFAKADGYKFPPWEQVVVSSVRVERQIADYCKGKVPIRIFDWNDEAVVVEYFRRHPEAAASAEDDSGLPNVNVIARMVAKSRPPEVTTPIPQVHGPNANLGQIPAMPTRGKPGRPTNAEREARAAAAAAAASEANG